MKIATSQADVSATGMIGTPQLQTVAGTMAPQMASFPQTPGQPQPCYPPDYCQTRLPMMTIPRMMSCGMSENLWTSPNFIEDKSCFVRDILLVFFFVVIFVK